MPSIDIIYSPVGPTTGSNATGTVMYHMTLSYTDASGNKSYISGGPSIPNSNVNLSGAQLASAMVNASTQSLTNTPSAWGTLKINGQGNYRPGDTSTGIDVVPKYDQYTGEINTDAGTKFQASRVTNNATPAQWQTIVQVYQAVASLNLTYSALTQNSNSLAATALAKVGLSVPKDLMLRATPAHQVMLPTTQSEVPAYLRSILSNDTQWYGRNESQDANGYVTRSINYYQSDLADYSVTERQGKVVVQAVKFDDLSTQTLNVFDSVSIDGDYLNVALQTGNLDIDYLGDFSTFYAFDDFGFDFVGIGDYNETWLDYSNIEFYGNDNWMYGGNNDGFGWDFSGAGEYGLARAEDPNKQKSWELTDLQKLRESMAAFPTESSSYTRGSSAVNNDWAVISAPR
jgi:hypothetical protein